jgi:hypothetical protein
VNNSAALCDEIGWGGVEPEDGDAWSAATSAVLVIAAGAYWATVWVLGGLAPLGYLAACRRESAGKVDVSDFCEERLAR